MIFGKFRSCDALNGILAHSLKTPGGKIRKGTTLSEEHLKFLLSQNINEVTVAKLEEHDIHEDEAARQLAEALVGEGIRLGRASTGRVNCFANTCGLFTIPRDRILACNSVSESITISTLSENKWVEAGKMVATIKIIPYAVSKNTLRLAIDAGERQMPIVVGPPQIEHNNNTKPALTPQLCVHQPLKGKAHLVQTIMSDTSTTLLRKTEQVTKRRLNLRNIQLEQASQCAHDTHQLAAHLKEIVAQNHTNTTPDSPVPSHWILISGASAISDRNDVIPQAVALAGGTVSRCGIPVDPGNLLMLGQVGHSIVIGIPGCARSPKHNGLDLFMDRLSCNLPITDHWISSLSIGGLIDEIIDRPQPRAKKVSASLTTGRRPTDPSCAVTAILLAGGSSKRFGADNKLLAPYRGKPLIYHTLDAMVAANISRLMIVLGHDAKELRIRCEHYLDTQPTNHSPPVEFVVNADFESGMGSSLKAGISTLLSHTTDNESEHSHAALVCLADMPNISTNTYNRLIAAMSDTAYAAFIPVYQGQRGNPVLLMPELFDLLLDVSGDVGARHLLRANDDIVSEVSVDDAGIVADYDTPEQLAKAARQR